MLRALAIVVAGTLVLFPTLHGWWFSDDDLYLGNPILGQSNRLWKAWFEPGSFIEYYPIEQTVQWYQWKLWALRDAYGYHLTNLILHLTSALLLWHLFSKLRLKWAWIGGLIFAIHPMMVDSVATACELKNTLSLPPFLLSMCFYLDYETTRKPRYYKISLLLFLVAMLCKISMFFFPFVILLYAWWKRDRIAWVDVKDSLPFFAISLVLAGLTFHAGAVFANYISYVSPGPIHLGGVFNRIVLAGLTLAFYFGHFFLPLHPLPFYPLWSVEPISIWRFIPWFGIALVVTCCWKRRHGWGRPVLFALGFFVLGLAPFLGFIETSYMCLTWVADHFAYIPIIALLGLVVAGLEPLSRELPRKFLPAAVVAALVAVVLLGFQTYSYASLFTDQEKLWTYSLKYNPDEWLARYQLGQAYTRSHEYDKAIEQFQESVRLDPDFYSSQLYLGIYLCNAGRFDEGASSLAEAVRLRPLMPEVRVYLAHALYQTGRVPEAMAQLNEIVRLQPNSLEARYGLSYGLEQEGRLPDAIAEIQAALDYYPRDPKLLARMEELENAAQKRANPPVHGHAPPK